MNKIGSSVALTTLTCSMFAGGCSHVGTQVHSTVDTAEIPPRNGSTVPGIADRLDQWAVNDAMPAVDRDYNLANDSHGSNLVYAAGQSSNLDWQGDSSKEWSFRKAASSQFVAIYNKKAGKYLVASDKVVAWTYTPTYQWSLSAPAPYRLALFNAARQDYLISDVHSARFGEVNWKFHYVAVPVVHEATVTMNAQPPVTGYVPFLGRFGGGSGNTGVLTEVRNPQQHNVPLFFVKPGHSSNECDQPDATFYLGPGAAMTAEQKTLLWGSVEPSLSTELAFLACAATSGSAVFVNVKYYES